MKQFPRLRGVRFECALYHRISVPNNAVVYCDPPYKNTTGYGETFDHEVFYTWVRCLRDEGVTVYISEYQMPEDFTPIWEKQVSASLTTDTGSRKAKEVLFCSLDMGGL